MHQPPPTSSTQSSSILPLALGWGMVGFYILFTLLPNSNSLMVKWPWVFIWQVGLMLGPVLLLFQLWQKSARKLGSRLDWLAIAWCFALPIGAAFAQFTHQAFWYAWVAICSISFLYVLTAWLTSSTRIHRLLLFQGILVTIFSALSLTSWFFQTVRPYLHTLEELKTYGIERSFDLQILTLRNWHPIGHQNYVAGYLVLSLPLLIGLALSTKHLSRWFWFSSVVLSLATLYSTASRASWLALAVSTATFIILCMWLYPKLRKALLGVSVASTLLFVIWGASSPRIRGLFSALFNDGSQGELSYRAVTNATGWFMGLDHPILGAGLGGVALLYQKYRPAWAGQEAELTYQLHSTPAQLWAELGAIGILLSLLSLCAVAYLVWCWCHAQVSKTPQSSQRKLGIIGTISGLVGYVAYAITDYQLDNICISGTLTIFIAILIAENKQAQISEEDLSVAQAGHELSQAMVKRLTLVGSSLVIAVSIWLYPIHRAWMLSSQGFLALQQEDIAGFVSYLERSHALAPWEPYYPYQLGWNLGELAFQSTNPQQQESLRRESVQWLEKAIVRSPYREFGSSSSGWLQINSNAHEATKLFLQSARLTPQKQGAFFALGYSLLREGKSELAVQSMVTELIQQPIFLTSPIWKRPELINFYPRVLVALESELTRQVTETDIKELKSYFYQILGNLNWWRGDFDKAHSAFSKSPTLLNEAMVLIAETRPGERIQLELDGETPASQTILAWQNPSDSNRYLSEIFFQSTVMGRLEQTDYLASLVTDLHNSMATSSTFYEWLIQAPALSSRYQRLGFNIVSRHIDGVIPTDFSPKIQNSLVSVSFRSHFLEGIVNTCIEEKLSLLRQRLYNQLSELSSG